MGRARKSKPNFWESPSTSTNQHFGRIYRELVTHPKFKDLSLTARLVYLEMLEASAGKQVFTFSKGDYTARKLVDKTFRKAREELIEKGFLKVVYSGRLTRQPNKYSFSAEWQSG